MDIYTSNTDLKKLSDTNSIMCYVTKTCFPDDLFGYGVNVEKNGTKRNLNANICQKLDLTLVLEQALQIKYLNFGCQYL